MASPCLEYPSEVLLIGGLQAVLSERGSAAKRCAERIRAQGMLHVGLSPGAAACAWHRKTDPCSDWSLLLPATTAVMSALSLQHSRHD